MNIDLCHRLRRTGAILLAGSALLAFSTVVSAEPPPFAAPADSARRALDDGHYADASRAFEDAARASSGPFSAEFFLSAAEAAQKAGDNPRAERLSSQIPAGSLDLSQMARLQIIRTTFPAAVAVAASVPITAALPALPSGAGLALILPLSGALASTAEAVRDGFLTAYLKSGGRIPVRLYDSGASNESSLAAYQQAAREGAGFIVGPLRKESIAAIAAQGQLQVPVLALNYLDEAAHVPNNFFQFGLAPEDEARAIAEQAVAQGDKRAIALVPQTEWGERVLAALDKRLRELGGGVLKAARFKPGTVDYSDMIQDLLNLQASQSRHNALTGIIGSKSEFESHRRDDVDFIFMASRPSEGHMIWPQLRFYRATGLPVYATSLIYNGAADSELNGVRFCDMPLMLQADSSWASLRSDSADLPAIKNQPRLFALGYDAYNLVNLMQSGKMQTATVIPAASGGLLMKANGAIARTRGCAQFRDGGIKSLDAAALKQ
jgi:outer membrane PBP1 activator LpoA protein